EALDRFCRAARLREAEPVFAAEQPAPGGGSVTVVIGRGFGGAAAAPQARDVLQPATPEKPSGLALTDGAPADLPTPPARAAPVRALPPGTPLHAEAAGDRLLALEAALEPALRGEEVLAVTIDRAVDSRGQAAKVRLAPPPRPAPRSDGPVVVVNGAVV